MSAGPGPSALDEMAPHRGQLCSSAAPHREAVYVEQFPHSTAQQAFKLLKGRISNNISIMRRPIPLYPNPPFSPHDEPLFPPDWLEFPPCRINDDAPPVLKRYRSVAIQTCTEWHPSLLSPPEPNIPPRLPRQVGRNIVDTIGVRNTEVRPFF